MTGPHLKSGCIIDGFTIGKLLHSGGMALIYEVAHSGYEIPLCLKLPRLFEGEDKSSIVGFEMEQMIMPRLSGPHVPRHIANGDFTRAPYIVMERIPGPSLSALADDLPRPFEEVAAIGAEIAFALEDLHRQHVVHLDVKPGNLLARPTGERVLIDFGLSHHEQLPDLMQEEFRLPHGTAPYMAPEQILGVRSDPASDLFSLGVLMYYFATGELPFGDPQTLSGLKRRLWRDPVPPGKLRPDIPPWLQETILRCLEVDPARRHPTAAQLAFDLKSPETVILTERAEKREQDPWLTALRRRFSGTPPAPRASAAAAIVAAPIVAVAIDLTERNPELAEALRVAVARVLKTSPQARLACLNVFKLGRIKPERMLDAEGRSKHVLRIAELMNWAAPLKLSRDRVTYHILEAFDAAAAIVDYAAHNRIDQIVMGARANSAMRSLLGSVSGEVAARAPCTVTVVRPPAG